MINALFLSLVYGLSSPPFGGAGGGFFYPSKNAFTTL